MGVSRTQKNVFVLVTIDCLVATSAEASGSWGWGRSSNGTTSSWGWGFGSSSGTGSSGTGSGSGWGWGSGSGWSWGWGSNGSAGSKGSGSWGGWGPNPTDEQRKIVVGGSAGWQYGFNYTKWALEKAPFHVNDVLVFKYDLPSPHKHNVYLLLNLQSYKRCDFTNGKMIGKASAGTGKGVVFELENNHPYYFACGEHEGSHYVKGGMKFTITPIRNRN